MSDKATQDPRWLALSPDRRSELLDKYRDWNTGHLDWWDVVEEQFKEACKEVGIEVEAMYFSGFWSQGDGACFEGYVSDWKVYLREIGHPELVTFADNWTLSCVSSGRYSHSGTMQFTSDFPLDRTNPYDEDEEPLQFTAWNIQNPNLPTDHKLNALEKQIIADFRSRANKLYVDLEKEHDYLTEDDTVVERLLEDLCEGELKGDEEEELAETAEEN